MVILCNRYRLLINYVSRNNINLIQWENVIDGCRIVYDYENEDNLGTADLFLTIQ